MAKTNSQTSIYGILTTAAPGARIRFAFTEDAIVDKSLQVFDGALRTGHIELANDDVVALHVMLEMGDWCGDASHIFGATFREPMPAWALNRLIAGLSHIELLT